MIAQSGLLSFPSKHAPHPIPFYFLPSGGSHADVSCNTYSILAIRLMAVHVVQQFLLATIG